MIPCARTLQMRLTPAKNLAPAGENKWPRASSAINRLQGPRYLEKFNGTSSTGQNIGF